MHDIRTQASATLPTTTITLNTNGQTYLHYYATDNAGNVAEERMMRVDIDKSATVSNNASDPQQTTHTAQFAWLRLPWLTRTDENNK